MKVEISIGELVDKVTILSIKLKKFKNHKKKIHVKKEYEILLQSMKKAGINPESDEFKKLQSINLSLWNIEDEIRKKELKNKFDSEFIELARQIYFQNDKRAAAKKQIDLKYGSDLIEEKEYVNY